MGRGIMPAILFMEISDWGQLVWTISIQMQGNLSVKLEAVHGERRLKNEGRVITVIIIGES